MAHTPEYQYAHIVISDDSTHFSGQGDWIIGHLKKIENEIDSITAKSADNVTLDMNNVQSIDSAGALLIEKLIRLFEKQKKAIKVTGLTKSVKTLLNIVASEMDETYQVPHAHQFPNVFKEFGQWLVEKASVIIGLVSFIGEMIVSAFRCIIHPHLISWRSVIAVFHNNCYRAMPIVALLNFLIGVVITYQMGMELSAFGMDILIVNISGMLMFREFAPLMTAIIAAGRTSTSFTAQVGTMIVNEEVNALRTMGMSPIDLLVIPKLIGILIAFPLLIVWANIFAILGSILVAKLTLGIGVVSFIERLQATHPTRDYLIGILKGPIFAVFITIVGCFQGFSVKHSADSIGMRTTISAVQSLFLIIIIDSLFTIIFPWQNL